MLRPHPWSPLPVLHLPRYPEHPASVCPGTLSILHPSSQLQPSATPGPQEGEVSLSLQLVPQPRSPAALIISIHICTDSFSALAHLDEARAASVCSHYPPADGGSPLQRLPWLRRSPNHKLLFFWKENIKTKTWDPQTNLCAWAVSVPLTVVVCPRSVRPSPIKEFGLLLYLFCSLSGSLTRRI